MLSNEDDISQIGRSSVSASDREISHQDDLVETGTITQRSS
jgi:hypothetical protein